MYRILLVLIFAHTSLTQVFDLTADNIFESIIGDVHEFKKKIDPPKTFKELRSFEDVILAKSPDEIISMNDTHIRMKVIKEHTTSKPNEQVTPLPTENRPNITVDDIKIRMRKIHLNKLLEDHTVSIPDFSTDSDNPEHITRRFESVVKEVKRQRKPDLRQKYFDTQNATRLYIEKQKTISLMEQFIYATRYRLPYMQLLRKKYNYHLKYKIGYCFALLRHLKQQQKLIYTSLHNYYKHFNNLMIHMKLYEKVVRLDVDIKDVCFLIQRLNYQVKNEADPTYYEDDEPRNFANIMIQFITTPPTLAPDVTTNAP